MHEIKRLSQQVINQIAAGEVVERPASAVKELIENSLDADATQIDLSIVDGGLTKIEVKDNGKGIAKEDLPVAFERYATSKLQNTEDLESIATYGFRGEALAAISSISKTTVTTRREEEGSSITSNEGIVSAITPSSRSQGTTVTIEHLFSSVPARQKFVKSAETEYKYILKVFTAFALLNGKTHFKLINNGKEVYNLPATGVDLIPRERIARIYAIDSTNLVKVEHEEYGIKITGYLVHPKQLGSTSKFSQIFINNRPIEDKGVFRAVQQGITDFVPDFYKPAFVLAITLGSDQVDVNVHPRKTEVKLLNPFRVYAALTHAVKLALQQEIAEPDRQVAYSSNNGSTSYQTPKSNLWERKQESAYSRLRGNQPQFFFDNQHYESEVQAAYEPQEQPHSEPTSFAKLPEYIVSQARLSLSDADISPILGRYIIVGFMDEVWVVDQHAAAERVRYEQFKRAYLTGTALPQQQLLTPLTVTITEEENSVLTKHISVLTRLGFDATIIDSSLVVSSIPTYLQNGNVDQLLRDTIAEFVEHDDIFLAPVIEDFTSEKNLGLIIATMACHNSVRMNERLSTIEAKSIVKNLLECDVPYACPHGRRVVWRLSKEEVDRQFMRT